MSEELAKAIAKVKESKWKTFATEAEGTLRQWVEVDFVPGRAGKRKTARACGMCGLRLPQPQGGLFNDGTDLNPHAVVSNLDWHGAKLLEWHRKKAGTVEHVHNEVKNGSTGDTCPVSTLRSAPRGSSWPYSLTL